jgi:dynein heavy chain
MPRKGAKDKGEGKDASEPRDSRLNWLLGAVTNAYRGSVKADKLKKFMDAEDTQEKCVTFLDTPECRLLAFADAGGSLSCFNTPPKKLKNRVLYFVKTSVGIIDESKFDSQILSGEISGDSLLFLSETMQEVYMPLLCNPINQEGWSELVTKDVMESMNTFVSNIQITLGQTEGRTCLPLPVDFNPEKMGASAQEHKDRVHALEGCLIVWTKQIKNVIKQDPEDILKRGEHAGPLEELRFWRNRAANLNAVFTQLQTQRVRRVLKFLDQSKSTYNMPFAKLCKEVFQARSEANDNVKFLAPLEAWLKRLDSDPDYHNLADTFRPLMHLILLVWKNSRYYNTPARLVVMMREVCNALISQSTRFMDGETVFRLIEAEETHKAVAQLKIILKICGTFKSRYFDYKAKANSECPQNPWRIQNNALFVRLDAFLERIHDTLDLTQTILQFSKLSRIEVGGTKGKTLTTSVQQVYADFMAAVASFQAVKYDIMDVDAKSFDDDFYEFRCSIKELERRLGSVLTQGFDDCATVSGRFKLLDSFDTLLERPAIQEELEKKHLALISSYSLDLQEMQQMFMEHRDNPTISSNLPPISGALNWCRGLLERIKQPMEKLKQMNRAVLDREEAREVVKTYTSLVASLGEYEHVKIEEWGEEIESSSQSKLKLPLLIRNPETGLLSVNFDPKLVELLREVKYFLLLGLNVPSSAKSIYSKVETFRRQTGNLDLIVKMYNEVQTTLLPVERPLLKTHLDKIDKTLKQGIKSINWKSHGIDFFCHRVYGSHS